MRVEADGLDTRSPEQGPCVDVQGFQEEREGDDVHVFDVEIGGLRGRQGEGAASRRGARHGDARTVRIPRGPGPGLGFGPDDDALFARGYPMSMRVDVTPAAAPAVRDVEKALDAIDPVLRARVSEVFAAAYLRGYRVGPLLFVDRLHPNENVERRAMRATAIASTEPITLALLEGTLRDGVTGMGRDTYGAWRLPEVLFLYEHFLGTDAVARAVKDHLVRLCVDVEGWGVAGEPDRTNAAGHHLALTLPWLLGRATPQLAHSLRAELATTERKKKGAIDPAAYVDLLHAIADPERPLPERIDVLAIPLALAHGQAAPLAEALARQPAHMRIRGGPGRFVWTLGSAFLAGPLPLHGMPLLPQLDSLAPLRDPGVVRAMAWLSTQRAAAADAAAWLARHAAYARPILEALAGCGDVKEAKSAGVALERMAGVAAPSAPADEVDVEAEITAVFHRLRDALARSDDVEAERKHIREAFDSYVEINSAAGDPTPSAYFTHRFGDHGLGKWAMLAVDVAGQD